MERVATLLGIFHTQSMRRRVLSRQSNSTGYEKRFQWAAQYALTYIWWRCNRTGRCFRGNGNQCHTLIWNREICKAYRSEMIHVLTTIIRNDFRPFNSYTWPPGAAGMFNEQKVEGLFQDWWGGFIQRKMMADYMYMLVHWCMRSHHCPYRFFWDWSQSRKKWMRHKRRLW